MRSFSWIQCKILHFLYTWVDIWNLPQPFIKTKNDTLRGWQQKTNYDRFSLCFLLFMCLLCPGNYGIKVLELTGYFKVLLSTLLTYPGPGYVGGPIYVQCWVSSSPRNSLKIISWKSYLYSKLIIIHSSLFWLLLYFSTKVMHCNYSSISEREKANPPNNTLSQDGNCFQEGTHYPPTDILGW